MKKKVFVLAMLATFSIAGCKVESGGTDNDLNYRNGQYSSDPVQGSMLGQKWYFRSGTAKQDTMTQGNMRLTLNEDAFQDPCAWTSFSKRAVLTSVPLATGDTQLGTGNPQKTATFSFSMENGSNNLVSTDGSIRITNITDNEVEGMIIANYDNNNFVNGTFILKICR